MSLTQVHGRQMTVNGVVVTPRRRRESRWSLTRISCVPFAYRQWKTLSWLRVDTASATCVSWHTWGIEVTAPVVAYTSPTTSCSQTSFSIRWVSLSSKGSSFYKRSWDIAHNILLRGGGGETAVSSYRSCSLELPGVMGFVHPWEQPHPCTVRACFGCWTEKSCQFGSKKMLLGQHICKRCSLKPAVDWLDCWIGPHGTVFLRCCRAIWSDWWTCFAISGLPLFGIPLSSLWVGLGICK